MLAVLVHQIIMKYSQSAVQERAYVHTVAIKQHTGNTNPHSRGIVVVVAYVCTHANHTSSSTKNACALNSCIFLYRYLCELFLCDFASFILLQYAMHNKTLPRKKQKKKLRKNRDTLADFSFCFVGFGVTLVRALYYCQQLS